MDFYLLFLSVLLLTIGLILVTSSIWTVAVRIPLIYLAPEAFRIVFILSSYNLVSGATTLPASCFAYRAHNTHRTRNSLAPMTILLCISSVFLICGVTHGLNYRKAGVELERMEPAKHLRCCGVNETNDWTTYSNQADVPTFCYYFRNWRSKNSWKMGCLEAIGTDLAWITAYFTGLCFMAILAQILAIIPTGVLYLTNRSEIAS